MRILIFGAGVIGTVYGWQLSTRGVDVDLLVRKSKLELLKDGIPILCTDERLKDKHANTEIIFHANLVDNLSSADQYDWIIVSVKSNQLDQVLPVLAENSGKSNILFFLNNWWGDEKIKSFLQPNSYMFGFSRLVSGWKNGNTVECMIFDSPGMSTMLGEVDGQNTPRLQELSAILKAANLKPEISTDITGWLKYHYIEYLGPIGAIIKAGTTEEFVDNRELVKEALLATREGLKICQARGIPLKSSPSNLRLFNLPMFLILPLAQYQYRMTNIQRFFQESISQGLDEVIAQYQDVMGEGDRLKVDMPVLSGFSSCFDTQTSVI